MPSPNVFPLRNVFALRIAQVEPLRQIHQEDDRELQAFAGVDGHDPYGILIVAERSRLRQILSRCWIFSMKRMNWNSPL